MLVAGAGRSAGFIAAHASLSSGDVDLCLIPEVPIVIEGTDSVLEHVRAGPAIELRENCRARHPRNSAA